MLRRHRRVPWIGSDRDAPHALQAIIGVFVQLYDNAGVRIEILRDERCEQQNSIAFAHQEPRWRCSAADSLGENRASGG